MAVDNRFADPWGPLNNDFSNFYCSYDKDRLASVFEDSHADIRKKYQDLIINIPIRNGTKRAFKILKTSVMHPNLNSKYPSIRSYIGVGLINPSERASIVLHDAGLFGLVISDIGHSYLRDDGQDRILISGSDYSSGREANCGLVDQVEYLRNDPYNNTFPSYVGNNQALYPVGETLTTYRFAGALTEQANNQVADGTVEGGLAWIVAMVNQINLLWVRDLSFQLQLIENNDLIIFTDSNPAPDDFKQVVPNDLCSNPDPMYCELQFVKPFLVDKIGPGGVNTPLEERLWEYGALFDTGYGGGLAYAPGATCVNLPSYEVFNHELGHNLGSMHNIVSENGWRCSLGGTIMGSRSRTISGSGDQYSSHTIEVAMFHRNNSNDYRAGFTVEETGSNIPSVIVPEDGFVIPKDTPFVIEGSSDPISDEYTFSWEQNDTSSVQFSMDPNDVSLPHFPPNTGPLFCTLDPNPNGNKRVFPAMESLLENNYQSNEGDYVVEKLPFGSREINMRLIVRTNDPYSGSLNHKSVKMVVAGSAGPFRVTSQLDSTDWSVGSEQTISWDVANTDDPDSVNCQFVDILISLDGSKIFDFILADSIPNNGSYSFTLPAIPNSFGARIMVRSVGNLFFDINNGPINIYNQNLPGVNIVQDEMELNLMQNEIQTFSISFVNDGEPNSILDYEAVCDFTLGLNEDFENLDLVDSSAYYEYKLPIGWGKYSNGRGWIVGTEDSSAWEGWLGSQVSDGYFDIPDWSNGNYVFTDDGQYNMCPSCATYSECYELNGCVDGSEDYLYSPSITLPMNSDTRLRFDSFFRHPNWQEHLAHVGVSLDSNVTWDTLLTMTNSDEERFVPIEINLDSYAGQNVSIVFHSEDISDDGWGAGWALDNIKIVSSPSWLNLNSSGYLNYGESAEIQFSINTTDLDTGLFSGNIIIYDRNTLAEDSLKITLNVTPSLGLIGTQIPHSYKLYQNYPNPFNPITEIQFSIPKRENMTLIIYDILGHAVATLFNGIISPGVHSIRWAGKSDSGNKVSGGIYFYKITTNNFVETRKMIFLK